jgi:hypothetical protein
MASRCMRVWTDSHEDKITETKLYLCEVLRRSALRRRWEQKEMALFLGTSESCVSRLLSFQVEELTLSQLFKYLAVTDPCFEILIST